MDGATTLSGLFHAAQTAYEEVVGGDGPPPTDDAVAKALQAVQTCMQVAAAADLYSSNEELREMSTKTLRVRALWAIPAPTRPRPRRRFPAVLR
jgi:hypothetical protein